MHLCCQPSNLLHPLDRPMCLFADKPQDLPKHGKIALLAPTSRRMLLEERDDCLRQIPPIAHLEPETEAVIGPAIALDVHLATPEELVKIIEQGSIICPQFEAESGFDPGPATIRAIQMNGKASLAIDQTNHIISSQHQVSPFGHQAGVLLWDQLTSFHVVRVPAVEGSPWVTYEAVSHIPERPD